MEGRPTCSIFQSVNSIFRPKLITHFAISDADLAGGARCATSAWSIPVASTVPATAAPGSASATRTGVAYCATKVSDPPLITCEMEIGVETYEGNEKLGTGNGNGEHHR